LLTTTIYRGYVVDNHYLYRMSYRSVLTTTIHVIQGVKVSDVGSFVIKLGCLTHIRLFTHISKQVSLAK